MSRRKPNLFIVGAARSGTTSLWYYLKSHPEVYMPQDLIQKEPAYFSKLKQTRFKEWEEYIKIFNQANNNHSWVGEASTAYLTDPGSASRIYKYNPEVKIIIILRNPADRAYSLYNWMVQCGYEYVESFENALYLENYRKQIKTPNYYEPEYYYNYLYFHSGLYYEQVKRYLELFDQNVLILKFEDFTEYFDREMERVCRFLDIEKRENPMGGVNYSVAVESATKQFILRKLTKHLLANREKLSNLSSQELKNILLKQTLYHIETIKKVVQVEPEREKKIKELAHRIAVELFSGELKLNKESVGNRDKLLKLGYIHNLKHPQIDEKTFLLLIRRYRPDIQKFSELVKDRDNDYSDWLGGES